MHCEPQALSSAAEKRVPLGLTSQCQPPTAERQSGSTAVVDEPVSMKQSLSALQAIKRRPPLSAPSLQRVPRPMARPRGSKLPVVL